MAKENKEGNLKIALEYISDESNNSIEDDFKATAKYIALMPNGLSVEKKKSKNKKKLLLKKNTRISSNNDEEIEYFENDEDDNDNNNINEKNTENIQLNGSNAKDSYNNNDLNNSDNNLIITREKRLSRSSNINYCINDFDNCNNSENNNINIKEEYNKEHSKSTGKLSAFSPIKKKRRIFLEEKKKRVLKKSIFKVEQKIEKKEETEKEKIYRKDKNGTEICKKNKKRVKISFLEPFAQITPIESFKKYNIILLMPKGEKYINSRDNCQCCIIF